MHNMSNIFYDYLSEKIIKYFKTTEPSAGEKFYVQFETEEQVKALYETLKCNTISRSYEYEDVERKQKYSSYELDFGKVQLIIAAAMNNWPHPDFLATLRNLVGVSSGYENKAILFIHCSSLDSILGGAGSLGKEGMPLNIGLIEKDIKRRIAETGYSNLDKAILQQYLENKSKELEGTVASIFEYEDIISCLNDSQIKANEYRKFELFPDDQLANFTGKALKNRLDDNHSNYVKVSEIHNFGTDVSKIENLYGDDGAKVLSKPDWEDTNFAEVKKFIESKKNKSTIEYNPIITGNDIWDKEEGSSKAKSRVRNIIVFIKDGNDAVDFALSFSDFTKGVGINVLKAYQSFLSVSASGKKLQVHISDIEDQAVFCRFGYEADGTKFDFKIAVLRCSSALLESVKTQYCIEIKNNDSPAIRINTEDDELVLNEYGEEDCVVHIVENNQVVPIKSTERLHLSISEEYPYAEDSEDVHFSLSTSNFVVPLIKAFAIEKPTVIEGLKLWYLKRSKKCDFELQGENSLVFGTKKYFTRDEFRKSLELENKFITLGVPFAVEKDDYSGVLSEGSISLDHVVEEAFFNIIDYYKKNQKLPSLSYINEELKSLYETFLHAVINQVNAIKEGDYLSDEQKGLFYLGTIKREAGDRELLLTPLHPLNIAYQLFINEQDMNGIEEDEIELLRKFQNTSMLPYINIDLATKARKLFVPVEQIHSPEWKVYVEEELPRYKGSKDFVSKLVAEKIREFVEHFSYLFSTEAGTPIKINLINTGDCREIVQGIVKYYVHELNSTKSKKVIPIQVTMYSDSKIDNGFEMMSRIDNPQFLVKALGIEARVEDMSIDEIIDIYRKNVGFYLKDIDDSFEYSHLTFMELDDDNEAISTLMDDIPTGVVMNGIASGVASEMLGNSYRTGFGTKFSNGGNVIIDIAKKYNALNSAMNGDSYRSNACLALKMGVEKQQILDRIYDASNWVTFINPKVDLNYFKSDPGAKDLLIIHYSDQYNMTSSGYDAITVTKKSKQYQNAISRYLTANGVEDVQNHSKKIINMFNALNGDWLLRMLSYKSHFPIEKLSILSAMKMAVKRYSVEDIIWVPISLEEILRVSGSVGLSQSGSIFSAKNLGFEGQTSDDLLLIGIKDGEKVKVTFYPIEVKIGKVESDYLEKGINQALQTRQIFDEILGLGYCDGKDIKTRLYRNFFMQQVMVNAGKMLLYEVGDENTGWDTVTQTDLRRKLLNEEYEIVESLIPNMGKAGVVSFREDCTKENELRCKDVLIVEKTKNEGVNLLASSFSDIATVDWCMVKDFNDLSTVQGVEKVEEENVLQEEATSEEANEESSTEVTNTEDEAADDSIRVLIGEDKYMHKVYWEFGNAALANRHLLITGTSGQGKTYSIQTMLYELAKRNISSVIFDYTEGFMLQQLEQPFKDYLGDKINQHIVYSTGVPINPFKRQQVELIPGQMILEKESDVAARLADIFAHVYDFGDQQYSAIFTAVYNGMVKHGENMDMRLFKEELDLVSEENKTAKSVLSKMAPFFHTVEFCSDTSFDWGDVLYAQEAKVNIIQLTMFTQEMKIIITEMMLWDAWYYTKKFGTKDKPFVVVLDEAQNLSHAIKSPSAAILTEGRKFGWSAWFATQSLGVLKSDEIVRLLQASFKLYFKPTDNEVVKTAKQLDATGETDWLPEIQKLKKGQCIVVGDKMRANKTVGPAAPVVTSISPFEERN